MAQALIYIFLFPGILFLAAFSLTGEYIDRKLSARFQNRVGPPWFQPLADFIKLAAKENIIPDAADTFIFSMMPVFAMASTLTAFFYIPLWWTGTMFSFNGDLVVVLYLLTIPTLSFFLGGWYSGSMYSLIGSVRSLTQLFAYEVPLLISVLAAALLADTWSLGGMTAFYNSHPGYWLFNIGGFVIAVMMLLGKLEKVPFDIPEAETEIVGGSFTEYSGRLLAIIRLSLDLEMIVGASLLAAVFLPWGLGAHPVAGFFLYIAKVVFIIALISLLRTVAARLRIDQMVALCWKYIAPLAFLQVIFILVIKGAFLK